MVRLFGVDKIYRLGEIGTGMLYRDIQSWIARRQGKPDPNSRIGQEHLRTGETFYALKDIDLTVRKGERLGIIGGNGAGKSTLLKLISRVTSPSAGTIDLYGRVTSMLEVGTGFHSEMTGRENIYLNGAILGMSKKETDEVLEKIIDFSEVREFIDTPVKRYSSGMYVKLGFAVAAHLRSEIVIMDEVLAVGDIAFQQKCIRKMQKAAEEEGRTILYVSHNMSTVRDLCTRCIVLDHGRILYDGNVEDAITFYSDYLLREKGLSRDLSAYERRDRNLTGVCQLRAVTLHEQTVQMGEELAFTALVTAQEFRKGVRIRMMAVTPDGAVVGMTYSDPVDLSPGDTALSCRFSTEPLAAGVYSFDMVLVEYENSVEVRHDFISRALTFCIEENERYFGKPWIPRAWGHVRLARLTVQKESADVVDP